MLTACIGNVCRSPVAERLLALRLEGTSVRFQVGSAGVRALVGRAMTPEAEEDLLRLGGNPEGFVARRLSEQMVLDSGLILTATTDVRRRVLEEAPSAMRRTFTWKEFAALVDGRSAGSPEELVAQADVRRSDTAHLGLDTDDPIGQSREVYARVSAEIDEAVTVIARALTASAAE